MHDDKLFLCDNGESSLAEYDIGNRKKKKKTKIANDLVWKWKTNNY